MPDWDEDSPQLEDNVKRLLREIGQDARRRTLPTVEVARRWQVEILRGGEAGLENIQVRIAGRYSGARRDDRASAF